MKRPATIMTTTMIRGRRWTGEGRERGRGGRGGGAGEGEGLGGEKDGVGRE